MALFNVDECIPTEEDFKEGYAILKKGKKVTIWQTVGKTSSEKISVKVVEKY